MVMLCPHCETLAPTRTSRKLSRTLREEYHQCQNVYCSHTFVAYTEVVRTIVPSGMPDPMIRLPIAEKQQRLAEDGQLTLDL